MAQETTCRFSIHSFVRFRSFGDWSWHKASPPNFLHVGLPNGYHREEGAFAQHLVRRGEFWNPGVPSVNHAHLQFKRFTDEAGIML